MQSGVGQKIKFFSYITVHLSIKLTNFSINYGLVSIRIARISHSGISSLQRKNGHLIGNFFVLMSNSIQLAMQVLWKEWEQVNRVN